VDLRTADRLRGDHASDDRADHAADDDRADDASDDRADHAADRRADVARDAADWRADHPRTVRRTDDPRSGFADPDGRDDTARRVALALGPLVGTDWFTGAGRGKHLATD
jgi:hypothetical protein